MSRGISCSRRSAGSVSIAACREAIDLKAVRAGQSFERGWLICECGVSWHGVCRYLKQDKWGLRLISLDIM